MAIFIRAKNVSAPLDDRLRGELTNYASSGSDHDVVDPSCFSALLNYFLDPDNPDPNIDSDTEIDSSSIPNPSNSPILVSTNLRDLLSPPPSTDPLRARIISAVESMGSISRRSAMTRLRELGFNAGICKSRWDGRGGLTAGSYEYIDVVIMEIRFIVDLGFKEEFEVARATEDYRKVVAALPEKVVALPEEVRSAVAIMAEAGRRSFKSRGMSVPPWRKKGYMMAKWLGFYRRTVNSSPAAKVVVVEEVGRRFLGFGGGGVN